MTKANRQRLLNTMRRLMETPTVPFREEWMMAELDAILAEIPRIESESDSFGNRVVRLRRGRPRGTPLVVVAHIDHPGFLVEPDQQPEQYGSTYRLVSAFEGRVLTPYFEGAPVRLFRSAEDSGIPGWIVEASEELPEPNNRRVVIETTEDPAGARIGMWDFPAFEVTEDGRVVSRACDDLAGCAMILEALRLAADSDDPDMDLTAIFTRAEEPGFCGMLCLLEEPTLPALIPRDGIFLSVETSGETAAAQLGGGALIRVGDRSSTFDGKVVDALWSLGRQAGLDVRRALMDRGTCEATPMERAGLRAGGICIPVRNYHNMDMEAGMAGPETVSVGDAEALSGLIFAMARAEAAGLQAEPVVLQRYPLFLEKGRRLLRR